jgi:predicted transcriptional regulator
MRDDIMSKQETSPSPSSSISTPPPLKKFIQIWRSEDMVKYVLFALDKYIKKDNVTKLSVFFTGLSAYLSEPINLFLKGESGIGKTHNAVQALRHFPKGDVWFLGGMSPKNLIHEHGVQLTRDGKPLESVLMERPEKPDMREFEDGESYRRALREYRDAVRSYQEKVKESYTLVDMSKKILVFLEAPEREVFENLLPILSHDREEIEYRFVDKTTKGLRSQRVVVKGWPATVFLSIDRSYMEDLATRSFTATPESSQEKIAEAHRMISNAASFPWEHAETEEDECIRRLILAIKGSGPADSPLDVVVPFPNMDEPFPKQIVRDMRDFQHFCQFVKPIALLQMFQRPRIEAEGREYVVATFADVWSAVQIYSSIFETTRTGSEERTLRFYHGVLAKRSVWYVRELVDEWNKISPKKVSRDWVEKALKRLIELGYVDSEPDPEDRRKMIYRPIPTNEITEIYRKFSSRIFFEEILKKGAQNWIKEISDKNLKVCIEKNSEKVELSKEELLSAIMSEKYFSIHPEGLLSDIFKLSKFTEKSPIGEKNIRETNYRQVSEISTSSPTVAVESTVQHIPEIRRVKEEECFYGKCSYCGARDVIEAYADGFGICGKCLKELLQHIEALQAPQSQSQSPTLVPEPKPSKAVSETQCCLNCKFWQGSEVTQIAYCIMFETSTPQTYSCGKWERRE